MADSSCRTFPYKGRIIQSCPDSTGNSTIYGYEASSTEYDRIKKTYGDQSVSTATGTPIVYIGAYQNNDRNNPFYFDASTDKAILGGISNYDLTSAIIQDTNFYQQATGNQSPNTSTQNPNQPSPDGGSSTPIDEPNKQKKEAQILTYPSYMSPSQDRIKFQACKINIRTPSQGTGLNFKFDTPTYKKVGDPVILGIQAPISDQNSVDWGPDTVNAIDAALFAESYKFMKSKNFDEAGKQLQSAVNNVMDLAKTNNNRIQKYLAGQAAGINNVLARTDNVILNPNLELLFQGPQLRPFSFQFKMSARDKDEAIQIKKIIRYFKENMAVKKDDTAGLFLKAPHVFTIRYCQGSDKLHKSINTISPGEEQKACALTNCSVDYTPLGSYMTYNDPDATMVAYTLSLQFQELTPIYDSDYKNLDENSIGY